MVDQVPALALIRDRALLRGHAMTEWEQLHAKADVHTSVCTHCQASVMVDFPAHNMDADPRLFITCVGDKIVLLEKHNASSRRSDASSA